MPDGDALGRGDEADARLEAPSVSRRHAELTCTPNGWLLADLGSTRGTYLNGIRLDEGERARVRDGDHLALGALHLTVTLTGPAFPEPPLAPRDPARLPQVTRDEFLTRGSLLLRLGDGDTLVRELSWQEFHRQLRLVGCHSTHQFHLPQPQLFVRWRCFFRRPPICWLRCRTRPARAAC